ncbi:interleukin-24 [Mastomys coucha]|uniref:interleukin-24 n=1 Tax=Mastomys coucha TaxID=35658 RepID=UPI001262161D|nr:interleukin-24 [Mastomys coucha]
MHGSSPCLSTLLVRARRAGHLHTAASSISHFRTQGVLSLSSTQMNLRLQILPRLSLILLVWNQVSGLQAEKFQFGPCQVTGVSLSQLWGAFRTVKNTVQTQDDITSVQLLKPQVLQNVSGAESCYLARRLLRFYLETVFKNYHSKIAKSKVWNSFSTLANNFKAIESKLQPHKDNALRPIIDSARQRFSLFHRAFKQLNTEVALVKAFGEVDILLSWMQHFYHL